MEINKLKQINDVTISERCVLKTGGRCALVFNNSGWGGNLKTELPRKTRRNFQVILWRHCCNTYANIS